MGGSADSFTENKSDNSNLASNGDNSHVVRIAGNSNAINITRRGIV